MIADTCTYATWPAWTYTAPRQLLEDMPEAELLSASHFTPLAAWPTEWAQAWSGPLLNFFVCGYHQHFVATIAPAAAQRDVRIWWLVEEPHRAAAVQAIASSGLTCVTLAWCPEQHDRSRIRMLMPSASQVIVANPSWGDARDYYQFLAESSYYSHGSLRRHLINFHQSREHHDSIGRSVTIPELRTAWQGKSFWCLAGGPSLERRLDLIRASMNESIIFAADVVAARVIEAGIRVDLVLSLDRHLKGWIEKSLPPEVIQAGNISAVPEIMARSEHPLYLLPRDLADWYGLPENHVTTGSNVGVSLISLAAACGAGEVIVAGLDLATEGAYYSNLVEKNTEKTENILKIVEGLDAHVLGNGGTMLATNAFFATSINEIHHLHDPTLALLNPNINDGIGAQLPHAEAMPHNWQPIQVTYAKQDRPESLMLPETDRKSRTGRSLTERDADIQQEIRLLGDALRQEGFAHGMFGSSEKSTASQFWYECGYVGSLPCLLAETAEHPLRTAMRDQRTAVLDFWQDHLTKLPEPVEHHIHLPGPMEQALQQQLGDLLSDQRDHWQGNLIHIATPRVLNLLGQKPDWMPPLFANPVDNFFMLWISQASMPSAWQSEALAWALLSQPQQWHMLADNPVLQATSGPLAKFATDIEKYTSEQWQNTWQDGDDWQRYALLVQRERFPAATTWLDQAINQHGLAPAMITPYLNHHYDPNVALQTVTALVDQQADAPTLVAVAMTLAKRGQLDAAQNFLPHVPAWHRHFETVNTARCEIAAAQQKWDCVRDHSAMMQHPQMRQFWQDKAAIQQRPISEVLKSWQQRSHPPQVGLAAEALKACVQATDRPVDSWRRMAQQHQAAWQRSSDAGTWQTLMNSAEQILQVGKSLGK